MDKTSLRFPESLPIEETNFLRFSHLILKVAPKAVRYRFDQEFPPSDLEAIVNRHKNTLTDLKRRRIINNKEWNLIFPGIGHSPASSNFDITLMICLFRHLTNISPQSGYYDTLPPPSDVTVGADLARIKYYRNNVAHLLEKDRKIDTAELEIVWDDISEAIGRIGGQTYKHICLDLLTTNLDSSSMDVYRDLCIEQQELIQRLKDPIQHHEREKINAKIEIWQRRDHCFVETTVAKKLMEIVETENHIVVTGAQGIGKSFTVQHVLLALRNDGHDVIPVTSSTDIVRYFTNNKRQIFFMDDFCGRINVSNYDIDEWKRNKEELLDIFALANATCVFTCRLQIYLDPKFKLLKLDNFNIFNMSTSYRLSPAEKKMVAQKQLSENVLENRIEVFNNQTLFVYNALYEMKKDADKLKYACIVLCVVFNNNVKSNVFCRPVLEETKQIMETIFEELDISVTIPQKTIISHFDSLVGTFFKKTDIGYKSLTDNLFDIFCSHVSETMPECLINYADSALISNRALFQSLNANDKSTLLYPKSQRIYFFGERLETLLMVILLMFLHVTK